jgi:MFS transporter, PPP family, 3-phenylpropionic acid transporter
VATLSVGWIAHRLGGPRGVLVALGLAAVAMIGAYDISTSFLAIFLVTMVWGFLWSPPLPLYDGVLVTETRKHGLDYARVRMWGSVAFIAGTFVCGVAVDRYGPPWVLYVAAAMRRSASANCCASGRFSCSSPLAASARPAIRCSTVSAP